MKSLLWLEEYESSQSPLPRLVLQGIIIGCCFPRLFHLQSSKHLTPVNTLYSRWEVSTEQARETEARRPSLGLAMSNLWGLTPRNPDALAAGQITRRGVRMGAMFLKIVPIAVVMAFDAYAIMDATMSPKQTTWKEVSFRTL